MLMYRLMGAPRWEQQDEEPTEGNSKYLLCDSVHRSPSWNQAQPPLKCVLQALGQLVGQRVFNRFA
jgi:hypothetical protein